MTIIESLYDSFSFLKDDVSAVRELVSENLSTGKKSIDLALRPFLDTPGKLLRPVLVVLSARMGGDFDAERIYRLAAGVEILHLATLIHDDIIDESPVRRGKPSVYVAEGVKRAVLLGDLLFTHCFQLSSDFLKPETNRLLASSLNIICKAEIEEEHSLFTTKRRYIRGICGKTALLFLLAASIGAWENDCGPETVAKLRFAGYGMGMSFQILDDILDFSTDQRGLGKPGTMDLKSGIATLPLIIARDENPQAFSQLARQRRTKRNIKAIRNFVLEYGGIAGARTKIAYYTNMATGIMQTMPENGARNAMIQLAKLLAKRVK